MSSTRRLSSLMSNVVPRVADPRKVNFWLSHVNPLWSVDQMIGRVVERQPVSADLLALRIRCNALMAFGEPGQHHPVTVEIAGRRHERHYSLTRIDDQHVQLHVKRVDGGLVSNWLWDEAKPGTLLYFGQPYGEVTLPGFSQRRLLWLAAGSGITPLYSLLRQLVQTGQLAHYQIDLLYWAQHQEDFAFRDQFAAWQQQFPHFNVHYFCTQQAPFDARLNADQLAPFGDLSQTSVFACGPAGFTQTARSLCGSAAQLQTEAFSLNIPVTDDSVPATVAVELTRSGRTLQISSQQPILQALEQAGLTPEHGCRMGICNQCVCHKLGGTTFNLDEQTRNTEPAQALKLCINTAQSDLILDL